MFIWLYIISMCWMLTTTRVNNTESNTLPTPYAHDIHRTIEAKQLSVVTHFTFFLIYIFWYFKRVFQHHLTHCAVEQCHFELFAAKITNNNRHQYTSLYLHSDKVLPQMPTKVLFFLLPFPILNQHFGKWDFEWKAKMMVNYNRIDEFR